MCYQFRDEQSGAILERYMGMGEAVEVGATIDDPERTGYRITRLASHTQSVVIPNIHFVSHQLPQGYKYAKKFDEWGSPCFDSKRELDECVARANHEGEHLSWDGK